MISAVGVERCFLQGKRYLAISGDENNECCLVVGIAHHRIVYMPFSKLLSSSKFKHHCTGFSFCAFFNTPAFSKSSFLTVS